MTDEQILSIANAFGAGSWIDRRAGANADVLQFARVLLASEASALHICGECDRQFKTGESASEACADTADGERAEPVAWVYCDTLHAEHCHLSDQEAINDGWLPLVYARHAGFAREDIRELSIKFGFKYWRASDAHGVTSSIAEAESLLADLLGVEVEIGGGKAVIADTAGAIEDRSKEEAAQVGYSRTHAGQEPVAIYHGNGIIDCGDAGHHNIELLKMIPVGAKLYLASPAIDAAGAKLNLQDVYTELRDGFSVSDAGKALKAVERSLERRRLDAASASSDDAQDAERYQWIATQQDWSDIERMCWSSTAKSAAQFKTDLDNYIDAAIAKESGK